MLSLDKKLYFLLYAPARAEYDLDMILAASTLCDDITVIFTQAYVDKNPLRKQFSALPEFGVKNISIDTPLPFPVKKLLIDDPDLINYEQLVDDIIEIGPTHTVY